MDRPLICNEMGIPDGAFSRSCRRIGLTSDLYSLMDTLLEISGILQ